MTTYNGNQSSRTIWLLFGDDDWMYNLTNKFVSHVHYFIIINEQVPTNKNYGIDHQNRGEQYSTLLQLYLQKWWLCLQWFNTFAFLHLNFTPRLSVWEHKVFFCFLHLIIKNYWLMLLKRLKSYVTDKVLPCALWHFGNSTMNTEKVKLFQHL